MTPTTRPIDSLDDLSAWKCEQDKSIIAIAPDDQPREGKSAMQVNVKAGKNYAIAFRMVKADPDWNRFDGLSFWAKGDGSDNYGCLRMQAGKWDIAWVANFPLKDTTWHRVSLAWGDFVPASATIPPLGSAKGFKSGDLNLIAFGKSWNFNTSHKSPEITFSIDDLSLEAGLRPNRPTVAIEKLPPPSTVMERLKSGKPVTILALGDSITWGTNVGGNANSYPVILGKMLADHFRNDKITIVNKAIGGSTTAKGRQWLHRDLAGVEADLVTVMFGFNEMPAPTDTDKAASAKAFAANMLTYVQEAAGMMKAPPACVFIATIPGRQKHWETLDAYAQAVRDLGKAHANVAVADVNAHFKSLGQEAYARLMSDEAHPNAGGQQEIANVLFETLTGQKPSSKPAARTTE